MPVCRPLASLAFLATSAACAAAPTFSAQSEPPLPGAAPRAVRDGVGTSDARIVQALADLLGPLPILAGDPIGVDSVNGVVTLRGQVSNQLAKERAVAVAQVVKGVRAIVDLIEVIPDPRPDYELQAVAAKAIADDPVLAGQRVAIRLRSGIAFLSGGVDSPACARLAARDVLALPGVAHVVDQLNVAPGAPSDERLILEARRLLQDDPWLDPTRVELKAQQGTLIASGWVGTEAERTLVESELKATAPRGIDLSQLRIDAWSQSNSIRIHPPLVRSDADLAQALTDALVRDPRVPPFVPAIDVHDGLVVLTGVAPNPYVTRAVAQDARDLPGVARVADELKTRPDITSASDRAVWLEVHAALDRDAGLAPRQLLVHVLDGAVYLTGCVASDAERVRALDVAAGVAGARDVQDGLLVGAASPCGPR